MVIVGITGSLASGKETAVKYLQNTYKFSVISLESEKLQNLLQEENNVKKLCEKILFKILENRTEHYIVYPITMIEELNVFRSSYNFLLIGIDCPIRLRYRNYVKKYGKPENQLTGFIFKDDELRFSNNLQQCFLSSDRIIQNITTVDDFFLQLEMLDILNFQHIRPSIEVYYSRMAEMISSRSGCIQHKAGCIVTNRGRIVSAGYSGIPKAQILLAICSK